MTRRSLRSFLPFVTMIAAAGALGAGCSAAPQAGDEALGEDTAALASYPQSIQEDTAALASYPQARRDEALDEKKSAFGSPGTDKRLSLEGGYVEPSVIQQDSDTTLFARVESRGQSRSVASVVTVFLGAAGGTVLGRVDVPPLDPVPTSIPAADRTARHSGARVNSSAFSNSVFRVRIPIRIPASATLGGLNLTAVLKREDETLATRVITATIVAAGPNLTVTGIVAQKEVFVGGTATGSYNASYPIRVSVKNKGNRATPADGFKLEFDFPADVFQAPRPPAATLRGTTHVVAVNRALAPNTSTEVVFSPFFGTVDPPYHPRRGKVSWKARVVCAGDPIAGDNEMSAEFDIKNPPPPACDATQCMTLNAEKTECVSSCTSGKRCAAGKCELYCDVLKCEIKSGERCVSYCAADEVCGAKANAFTGRCHKRPAPCTINEILCPDRYGKYKCACPPGTELIGIQVPASSCETCIGCIDNSQIFAGRCVRR